MEYSLLGPTGVKLSKICLGTATFGVASDAQESDVNGMEAVVPRTPGVPPTRTDTHRTPRYAPKSARRSTSFACVSGLRNEKVRGSSSLSSTQHESACEQGMCSQALGSQPLRSG